MRRLIISAALALAILAAWPAPADAWDNGYTNRMPVFARCPSCGATPTNVTFLVNDTGFILNTTLQEVYLNRMVNVTPLVTAYLFYNLTEGVYNFYADAAGTSQLPFEVASGNRTGVGNVWPSGSTQYHHTVMHFANSSMNNSVTPSENGTMSGATLNSSSKIGNGIQTDAINEFVWVPFNFRDDLGAGQNITISLWFKHNDSTCNAWEGIFGDDHDHATGTDGCDDNCIGLSGNKAQCVLEAETLSPASYCDGNWHHVVCQRSNLTGSVKINLYVDGNNVSQAPISTFQDRKTGATVNPRYGHATQRYSGYVDELRIRTDAESEAEMIFEFNNTVGNQNVTYFGAAEINNTLVIGVSPSILYTDTDANFSISYMQVSGFAANITVNLTVNGANVTQPNPRTYPSVASGTTFHILAGSGNYSKNDNITIFVNLTVYTTLEAVNGTLTMTIQNRPPGAPTITFSPVSAIVGDSLNATASATDADGDSLTFWFLWGYNNGSNITGWTASWDITVNASDINSTFRVYVMANDGGVNGTSAIQDMNVTRVTILWPAAGTTYYGKTFFFAFNATVEQFQPCTETIGNDTYSLGNITGNQNHSRTVWYGNHTYVVTCTSLRNASLSYSVNASFRNTYGTWNVSIYTENDWDVPLNISGANLSIIIKCEGGASYVYNFTGVVITGVEPLCDVETVSAKVDYPTDSYLRERIPPCTGSCEVRMYMADALIYTILQIPIYMSDYNYYDSLIELYKLSGGNSYTIAQGYFDVEHKYVTYLMKDNTYLIRITKGGVIKDIGYLYAATATAQYLSLSSISLSPSIRLISDNIRMTATMLTPSNPTTVLRINYEDFINMTEGVRIRVFQSTNNTPFFDNTYTGSSNFSISLNNINTSFRYSVHFTVNHTVLGNSPIDFTVGVGRFGISFDLGLDSSLSWLYAAFGFVLMLFTSWIIIPENRLSGYLLLFAELGTLSIVGWFTFQPATTMLFVAFLASGILFEIRHRGVT